MEVGLSWSFSWKQLQKDWRMIHVLYPRLEGFTYNLRQRRGSARDSRWEYFKTDSCISIHSLAICFVLLFLSFLFNNILSLCRWSRYIYHLSFEVTSIDISNFKKCIRLGAYGLKTLSTLHACIVQYGGRPRALHLRLRANWNFCGQRTMRWNSKTCQKNINVSPR